ncbi:MAG: SPOR domain-containing protein [Chitinophagaceae bacterium]|nr:SPOR domain-containing protein [Chitinophagaceae bacterium]
MIKRRTHFLKSPYFLCALVLAAGSQTARAQAEEENIPDTESVVLYADPRIALLTGYRESPKPYTGTALINGKLVSGSIHSGKGFRILIYSGTDRNKANQTKADFMRKHPGKRVYMTYSLPQYKIKVGDYTSRQEANELYRQLSGVYSPCMVVPDIVEINTFRKND